MPEPTPADREPARTDAAAKKRFRKVLQASLSAVDATAQWVVTSERGGVSPAAVTIPSALRLRRGDGEVYLRSTLSFSYEDDSRYAGERKVTTRDYAHTVSETMDGGELFSWQWHPSTANRIDFPHLHVYRGVRESEGLGKLHIPTGRVAFEQVLLFLIDEMDVDLARADGRSKLDESFRKFKTYRQWA